MNGSVFGDNVVAPKEGDMVMTKTANGSCTHLELYGFWSVKGSQGWKKIPEDKKMVDFEARRLDTAEQLLGLQCFSGSTKIYADKDTPASRCGWLGYKIISCLVTEEQNMQAILEDLGFKTGFVSGTGQNTMHPGTTLILMAADPAVLHKRCLEVTSKGVYVKKDKAT